MNQVISRTEFDDADESRSWLVVQAKPNMVPRAQRHLENQGFRVFVPQIRTTQRKGGAFKDRQSPLFPGYLFVQIDPEQSPWRKINSTFGVSRLVSFTANRPAVVPSGLITDLRCRFSAEIDVPPDGTFESGSEVEVIRGPFAGFSAKVESTAPKDRIWLLLDFLGRETRLSVEQRNVIKA